MMAPVTPRSTPETPKEIFEAVFSVARTIGNSSNATLSMTLAVIARDARNIRLNGKPLIQLLADDPAPKITEAQIANTQNLEQQKFQMQLTQKICSLMQMKLGLKKCAYDETAIKEHLTDPKKPLPAPIKHALSLLSQDSFSHLAHNVGAGSIYQHGYIALHGEGGGWVAVTMDLHKQTNGDVVVRASCGIQHLKSFKEGQKDLKDDSPLITFKTEVTLPVSNGTLKCEADQGLLYKDSKLETNVSQTVMRSNNPQFVPLKNMKNTIRRSWVDRALDRLIDPTEQPQSFTSDEKKLLYYKITKQEQTLLAQGEGRGLFAAINRSRNAPSLEVLEKAKDYLMQPSDRHKNILLGIHSRNTCNPDVDALVKNVMILHCPPPSSLTPAEIFESKLHEARQASNNPDMSIYNILADVVRDIDNINLNKQSLINLLAADPEPKITREQINAMLIGSDPWTASDLTKKICLLMQSELGLTTCVYDADKTTKHLNDPTNHPLPDEMKHALSLLSQNSFSHLAHNVGAGSMYQHRYIIPSNGVAVTMNLAKAENGDVVVESSCGIQHLISHNQPPLGEPAQSPFITFTTNVTLPVRQGHLQVQEDDGLLFEPCKLQTIVSQTVKNSDDPQFAPFKAMGKMTPPVINPEFDTITEIQPQEFKSPEQKKLYTQLTTQEQAFIDKAAQKNCFMKFQTFKNAHVLNAFAQARDCLMDPTDKKIAALRNINLSKDVNLLMKSIINYSQTALPPPDPNIASSQNQS